MSKGAPGKTAPDIVTHATEVDPAQYVAWPIDPWRPAPDEVLTTRAWR